LKRVVVDPNVLLSALVGNPDAAPAILLGAIHDHAVEMVTCPTLIAEVRDNLTDRISVRCSTRTRPSRP
jgi:predicted nucleic acid-binding protein